MGMPVKYALLVDGELLQIRDAAKHFGVHTSVLHKAAKRGELSIAWIEAWKRRRWLFAEAKRLGVSNDLIWQRRQMRGECDEIYLTPVNDKFSRLSAQRVRVVVP